MSVLTLADAKTHLDITTTQYDAELQKFIDSAESYIGELVGPLTSTATTKRVRGRRAKLQVPVVPLISVTSVTPVGGTAMDLSSLTYDSSGVIEFLYDGVFLGTFYDVVYQAGWSPVPEGLMMAIKEKVRDLFGTQRGVTFRRPTSDSAGGGYPSQFGDLIQPFLPAGFA